MKDRTAILRHVSAREAEADGRIAATWKRLAAKLASLAPAGVQSMALDVAGHHALLCFVADGKYRMQVFALEDRRDGVLNVYLPNVLKEALHEKVLAKNGNQFLEAGPGRPAQFLSCLCGITEQRIDFCRAKITGIDLNDDLPVAIKAHFVDALSPPHDFQA